MIDVINIKANDSFYDIDENAICLGYFDGIHLGHRALIKNCVDYAKSNNLKAALLTFEPDPNEVIHKTSYSHLSFLIDKIDIIKKLGISKIFVIEFNEEVLKLSPNSFIKRYLYPLNAKAIICGYDFTFGKDGRGDSNYLKLNNNFKTIVVDRIEIDGLKVSSSRIRQLINDGNINKANELLNHHYSIKGIVIRGRKLGRTIGYPTANIKPLHNYLIPKQGVYAGYIEIDGNNYGAMINIGHNSKFNEYKDLSIEVYIFDFASDIYNAKVKLSFTDYIRDEIVFEDINQLQAQLKKDKIVAYSCYTKLVDKGDI